MHGPLSNRDFAILMVCVMVLALLIFGIPRLWAEPQDFCKQMEKYGLRCTSIPESTTQKIKEAQTVPARQETPDQQMKRWFREFYLAIPDICEHGKDCPDDLFR